jgi:hypothetical protein
LEGADALLGEEREREEGEKDEAEHG